MAIRHNRSIVLKHVTAAVQPLPTAPLRDEIELPEVIHPSTPAASETDLLEDSGRFLEAQGLDPIFEYPMELAGRSPHRRLFDEVEMVREPDDGGDVRVEGRISLESQGGLPDLTIPWDLDSEQLHGLPDGGLLQEPPISHGPFHLDEEDHALLALECLDLGDLKPVGIGQAQPGSEDQQEQEAGCPHQEAAPSAGAEPSLFVEGSLTGSV